MERSLNYSEEVNTMVMHAMDLIREGKIRNHKIRNTAREHTNELEEQECNLFSEFLTTKNCDFVLNLTGCDNNG